VSRITNVIAMSTET